MRHSPAGLPRWTPVLIAFGVTALFFLLQSDTHLNWADEGFLWYGVLRTRLGEMPVRDFQSYDPLRYYWCAAFGDGILAMRKAEWLFQAAGVSFGLLALKRAFSGAAALGASAVVLVFWQIASVRVFDSCWPMFGVLAAARLLEKRSAERFFQAGAVTGLSLFMGLNHALYFLAGFSALLLFGIVRKAFEAPFKKLASFGAGVLAGLLPTLLLCLAPGYLENYLGRFAELSQLTDIRSPVPWPWTVRMSAPSASTPWTGWLQYGNLWAQGAAFLSVLLFYAFALWKTLRLKKNDLAKNALFLAAFFIGLPYLNHAFSRADILHLGEALFPVLAGVAALIAGGAPKAVRRALALWTVAVTLLAALPLSVLFFKATFPKEEMVPYSVGNDRLWLMKGQAAAIDALKAIVRERVPADGTFFAAPIIPTLYCLTGKPSPAYQIYFWWAGSESAQERTVRELEESGTDWALVTDMAIDGKQELRFSRRYARVWGYLAENFEPLPVRGLPDGYSLLKRKGP